MVDRDDYAELLARPDVMARGAIEHTADLLRMQDAALADRVIAVMAARPLLAPAAIGNGGYRDHFVIDLSSYEVHTVLRALTDCFGSLGAAGDRGDGQLMLLRALMQEWSDLADFLETAPSAPPPIPNRRPPDPDLN